MKTKLDQAIKIAKEYHKWQLRNDGTPYINHPLRVTKLLEKYLFPEEILISAVLHDICEDTKISNLNINELFWNKVWFIVNALSKNKKPKHKNKEILKIKYKIKKKNINKVSDLEKYNTFEEYIDFRFHLYLNRLYTWILVEPWIFFIKISDQIDNLSDMKAFSIEKKERKINEVEKYFLPIYEKCSNVFDFNQKYVYIYREFIELLKKTVEKAKLNINK